MIMLGFGLAGEIVGAECLGVEVAICYLCNRASLGPPYDREGIRINDVG